MNETTYSLGIDIGSTTVKIAILDEEQNLLFSDYERHYANIQETLAHLLKKAYDQLGEHDLHPVITGSGGLTLAKHLEIPFVQEVIAVSTSLKALAPQTDVAIELGGEDAKIICACGEVIETRSTKPEIRVEVCSKCHPFYTGKQKLVDSGGRVDRFNKRFNMGK